jgi:ribosomal protein S27AE
MSPDKMRIAEVLENHFPVLHPPVCEAIAETVISAGATFTETAEWKVAADEKHNRPYCTRCGEECLFDGWGFPAWSKRCPNCGAIMTNAKEK